MGWARFAGDHVDVRPLPSRSYTRGFARDPSPGRMDLVRWFHYLMYLVIFHCGSPTDASVDLCPSIFRINQPHSPMITMALTSCFRLPTVILLPLCLIETFAVSRNEFSDIYTVVPVRQSALLIPHVCEHL